MRRTSDVRYNGSVPAVTKPSAAAASLRLLVFDRTCVGRAARPGLSDAWNAGRVVYQSLGRIDDAYGASSWTDALEWLVARSHATGRAIGEVQYWGHGRRGRALVADDVLDARSLHPGGTHFQRLGALRACFAATAGGWWFRTCETLGGTAGHAFARAWCDTMEQRVAGHTHVIGFWQSGLHTLRPGAAPAWSVTEGLRDVHDEAAVALGSSPLLPHTIQCLRGTIPRGW
jgi:hypothetical protein